MASINKKIETIFTHEGAVAKHINPELQLRRSVMACLLWEKTFYEDGIDIADRIASLVPLVNADKVSEIAIEAREQMKLRHVPLLIVREMSRHNSHKHLVARTLERIIQRADELVEFMAIYWKDKKQPLSAQVKKGLAKAFTKFNEYELAKYDRGKTVKLKDVLFLSHAKPKDNEQSELWKRLINGTMEIPDTWEVSLSTGKDKKGTWERLISEKKLGGLALLRNLRNMKSVNVDENLIFEALNNMRVERILPFNFISAAISAPQWEDRLEPVMLKCLEGKERLLGKTILLVDVSASMGSLISVRSETKRRDVACGLAILAREICEDVQIFTFSNWLAQIPPRRGFALRDAIVGSLRPAGTRLGKAIHTIHEEYQMKYDTLIVFTDEQTHDVVPDIPGNGYIVNVAPYKNGIGYGAWTHIDGFSEAILDYIVLDKGRKE